MLTNDGDLARHLELPSTGWSRKYRVRVQGYVNEEQLASLAKAVTIDGITYGQVMTKLDRQMASNAWLTMAIREGKNREIRRIMEHLGHQVSRLIRSHTGRFNLATSVMARLKKFARASLLTSLALHRRVQMITGRL
ncbi:MAG: hypothetical protein CM15mP46_3980 [Alphaproteobacteria bacterium]|nr:MAG: hypothetical protein CM15mP46_3980 [Alphaproteobacteria bacterium]